jgi:hypothetical protein
MLLDVYGRPRMAPRAGFELKDKLMMNKGRARRESWRTPSDTPSVRALDQTQFARNGAACVSTDSGSSRCGTWPSP